MKQQGDVNQSDTSCGRFAVPWGRICPFRVQVSGIEIKDYASEAVSFCSADFNYARGLLFNGDLYTETFWNFSRAAVCCLEVDSLWLKWQILIASMFFFMDALLLLVAYHSLSPTQSDVWRPRDTTHSMNLYDLNRNLLRYETFPKCRLARLIFVSLSSFASSEI